MLYEQVQCRSHASTSSVVLLSAHHQIVVLQSQTLKWKATFWLIVMECCGQNVMTEISAWSLVSSLWSLHKWLPCIWLQTSWRDSGSVLCILLSCIRKQERKFPDRHWPFIYERGHTCMYQRPCNINHYLGDIVTTKYLWENHHKSIIIFWNAVVVTCSQMSWGLSVVRYDLGSGCLWCN